MVNFLIGFSAALLGALGMGGGSVLLVYLTAFAGVEQLTAQGINLMFFFPVAIIALIFHCRNKLVQFKIAAFTIIGGIGGVFLGKWLAEFLGNGLLRKAFAVGLLLLGIHEIFIKTKND